jgi:hypothetical protein
VRPSEGVITLNDMRAAMARGSSPEVGSSKKRTAGSLSNAPAGATR